MNINRLTFFSKERPDVKQYNDVRLDLAYQLCYSKGYNSIIRVHTVLIVNQTFWQVPWSKKMQKSKNRPCTSIRPKIPENVTYNRTSFLSLKTRQPSNNASLHKYLQVYGYTNESVFSLKCSLQADVSSIVHMFWMTFKGYHNKPSLVNLRNQQTDHNSPFTYRSPQPSII